MFQVGFQRRSRHYKAFHKGSWEFRRLTGFQVSSKSISGGFRKAPRRFILITLVDLTAYTPGIQHEVTVYARRFDDLYPKKVLGSPSLELFSSKTLEHAVSFF